MICKSLLYHNTLYPVYSSTTEGTFTFSDGTTFTKTGGTYGDTDVTWSASFTHFKDAQPVASENARNTQDCVKTDGASGKWDDVGCNGPRNYACQKPAV